MNTHEYQAKDSLAKYGVAVPAGYAAMSVDEAAEAAGAEFIDVLEMFLADDETQSIIMIGAAGIAVSPNPSELGKTLKELLRGRIAA